MEPVIMTEDELSKMKYADLQKLAKEIGVSGEGNKATLIARILDTSDKIDNASEDNQEAEVSDAASEDVSTEAIEDADASNVREDSLFGNESDSFDKELEYLETEPEYVTLSSPITIFRGPSEYFPVGSFGGMLQVVGKVREFYSVDYVRAGLGLTHGYALQREVDACRLSK